MPRSTATRAGALLCAALVAVACRPAPEVPAASSPPAYEGDAAAQARVQAVLAMDPQQRCAPEAIGELQAVNQAYPDAAAPFAALRTTLEACQRWEPLAALLASRPAAARTQQETVDLARLYIIYLQRFAEGEALIRPLVLANPDNVDYVALLTSALFYQRRVAEAAPHVDRIWDAIVANGLADVMAMRAMAYHEAGQSERARRILEQAQGVQPQNVFVLTSLGQVAAALGDATAAETAAAGAQAARDAQGAQVALNTRLQDIYRRLGEAYNQGLFLDVEPLAKQLLEGGAPPDLQVEIHRVLSRTYLELGRMEDAAAAADEASRIERELAAGTLAP